jgi:hypothetical protein
VSRYVGVHTGCYTLKLNDSVESNHTL